MSSTLTKLDRTLLMLVAVVLLFSASIPHAGATRAEQKSPITFHSIKQDSAYYRAGLRSGDKLVQLDSTVVSSIADYLDFLKRHKDKKQGTLKMLILRGGKSVLIPLDLRQFDLETHYDDMTKRLRALPHR